MPLDIRAFNAQLATTGLMRDNRFEVAFGLPAALVGAGLQEEAGRSVLTCEAAVLPGSTLQVNPVRRYGYGPLEMKPYGATFAPADFIFRVDSAGRVFDMLHAWQQAAVNTEFRTGVNTPNGPRGSRPYEIGYLREYAVDIQVTAFDLTNQPGIVTILRDAFPFHVADIPMKWASKGDYMRVAASFMYADWSRDQSLF